MWRSIWQQVNKSLILFLLSCHLYIYTFIHFLPKNPLSNTRLLYVVCCMFYVVYFMLYVLCCIFYVVCFMLYILCCMFYVVCFMFYKFYCLWWIEHVHNQAFRTLVRLSQGFCKVALLFPIRWFPKKNVVETSIHIS